MADSNFVSAQVSDDTAERFGEFVDTYGLTKSQAVRMFVESGLDVVERDGMDSVVRREYQLTGHSPNNETDQDDREAEEIEAD